MPIIHREAGLVFRFFFNEGNEPAHIHIYGDKDSMKVWLNEDLEIAKIRKLPFNDQRRGLEIAKRNRTKFLYAWFEFKKSRTN